MSLLTSLECSQCARRLDANGLARLCPDCSRPLLARYDLEAARRANSRRPADLADRPRNVWRFHELQPVRDARFRLTLGEGGTPLVHARRLGERVGFASLYIKDESMNPTASFKARGMAVAISRALELGVRALLAVDELFPDVLRGLRAAAPWATGQLVDALLDRDQDPVVRRRIPRVLKVCPTSRAAEGLQAALDDPLYEIRAASAAAPAAIHERSAACRISRQEVLEHVRRELDSGEPVDRKLPHLFALLFLTVERQPLQIAWAAPGARTAGSAAPRSST